MNVLIRPIEPGDNKELALVIRETLTEFGANRPGTAFYDESTDMLYGTFQLPRSAYFVAVNEGTILGGGGIYPTAGLPVDTCELVKMYLRPAGRGLGIGRKLIETCLQYAWEAAYEQVYLESMPELRTALSIYEKFGFDYLAGPMGNTGHTGCSLWMLKKATPVTQLSASPHTPG